jgi:hypothetical protein
MATPIQSVSIPFELSFDGGLTWKPLVCLSGWTWPTDTATTTVDTQCGRFYGFGPVGGAPTANAVCTTDANPTEITYKQLEAALEGQVTFLGRVVAPQAGSFGVAFYNKANLNVTSLVLTDETNNPIKFAVVFAIQGAITHS